MLKRSRIKKSMNAVLRTITEHSVLGSIFQFRVKPTETHSKAKGIESVKGHLRLFLLPCHLGSVLPQQIPTKPQKPSSYRAGVATAQAETGSGAESDSDELVPELQEQHSTQATIQ